MSASERRYRAGQSRRSRQRVFCSIASAKNCADLAAVQMPAALDVSAGAVMLPVLTSAEKSRAFIGLLR